MTDVQKWIKNNEGIKLNLYKDSVNKWTIGYGRNISANGISLDEAELMFQNDFNRSVKELENYAWYHIQPAGVKQALINMNFNLGIEHFLSFKKMIRSLINKDYTNAAVEVLDSKWADEVGQRAKDVAVMIREAS